MVAKPKTDETDFTLTIQGFEWKVEFREDLKAEDGFPLCGFSDPDNWSIVLRKGMSRQLRQSTLFHEIFHSIVSAISSASKRSTVGFIFEEHAAELFGRGMVELLTQKHLVPSWVFNEPPRKTKR